MATFNFGATTVKELKGYCKLLTDWAEHAGVAGVNIATKQKKEGLGKAFLAAMETMNQAGKLEEVPGGIFAYYKKVAVPDGDGDAATTKVPKEAPKKAKRKTRGSTMAELLKHGLKPGTRKEWAGAFKEAASDISDNEAAFRVGVYVDFMTAMGWASVDSKGVVTYHG